MSTSWVPPPSSYHLRIFAISLLLVAVALLGFLFGVQIEAVTPATGILVAPEQWEVRAALGGLVEPGWYEGELIHLGEPPVRVRLNGLGDGITDPAQPPLQVISQYRLPDGSQFLRRESLHFHRLQPGDLLWPGQPVALVNAMEDRLLLAQLEEHLWELAERGGATSRADAVRVRRDLLREHLHEAALRVPRGTDPWLTLAVDVSPRQAVRPGDRIATLVPVEAATGRPRRLVAQLDVTEDRAADLAPGQFVRLYSTMYNHRLYGIGEAHIERVEPQAQPLETGRRGFQVHAPVAAAPFPLPVGSSCKADIVVGRKPVYRVILEH